MNYKKMIVLPIALLVVSAIYLMFLIETNNLVLDIDFKGGTQILAESERQINEAELENVLKEYEVGVRTARGITTYTVFIEFDASIKPENVLSTLKQSGYEFKDYSIQTIGPSLGTSFFQQASFALMFSFIFMAFTIFFIFKNPLPSFYLVLTVIADLTETLVFSQIFGLELSLASFAALLLLIGYSVDDNILLTTRVLKTTEGGTIDEKVRTSFKTGITMVGTALVALLALFIISASIVIDQIASVLVIGLLVDLFNSWILNVGLLQWYIERKMK